MEYVFLPLHSTPLHSTLPPSGQDSSAAETDGFISLDQFPITTAARTAKSGLAIGLGYGLAQDAVGAARGRIPGYVQFLRGGRGGSSKADTDNEAAIS